MIAVFTAWHRVAGVKVHHLLNYALSSGILAPPNADVAIPLVTPNCCS